MSTFQIVILAIFIFFLFFVFSTFQIFILAIFIFFLLFAVLVFAGVIPFFGGAPSGVTGTVIMWGTVSNSFLDEALRALNKINEDTFAIAYVEKRKESFDRELVEALAKIGRASCRERV